MPVFNNALAGAAGSGGADGYKIERSLRFDEDSASHLTRTPPVAGNQQTWTWSGWIKTTTSSTYRALIEGYTGTPAGANRTSFQLNNGGKLHLLFDNGNSGQLQTSGEFKDPSGWFHVVLAVDTTQSTASNRVKMYVNGKLLESGDYDVASYPNQNYYTGINNTQPHYINRVQDPKWGDWYAADIHLIDAQQLDCTSFGEFDAETGVWNPIEYTNTTKTGLEITAAPTLSNGALIIKGVNNNTLQGVATSQGGGLNFWTSVDGINWSHSGSGQGPNSIGGSSVKYVAMGGAGTADRTWRSTGPAFEYALWNTDASFDSNTGTPGNVTSLTYTAGPSSNYGHTGFRLNFDPTASVTYSGGVSSTSTVVSGYPAANGFDGSAGSSGTANWYTQGANQTITVNLSSYNVSASSSVGFNVRLGGPGSSATVSVTATIGGTAYTQTFQNSSTQDQLLTFNASGTVTTIVATLTQASSSYGWGFTGVQVDGSYLVNLQAPGVDASGRGNHWTPVNLLPATGKYLDDMSGTQRSGFAWAQAFDGRLDHGAVPNASSSWTFTPSIPIPFSTLAIYAYKDSSPGTLKINGANVTSQVPNHNGIGPNQRTVITGISSPITSIQNISNGGLANIVFAGLEIDGGLLLDRASEVDVLIDSPTNYDADSGNNVGNYATLNPLVNFAGQLTPINGNLDVDTTGLSETWRGAVANICLTSGKWYAEFTVLDKYTTNHINIGINPLNRQATPLQSTSTSGHYYNSEGQFWNGSSYSSGSYASYDDGDIIGVAVNFDTNQIHFYKNGTEIDYTNLNSNITTHGFQYAVAPYSGGSNVNRIACNFGQRPFAHPVSGYNAVCTQNLLDPGIKKSSEQFDISLWTVPQNNADTTISGLDFGPDWLLTKNLSQNYNGFVYDTVRGDDKFLRLFSSSSSGTEGTQATRINLTSDGYVFEGAQDNANYGANSRAAGWAWNAGTSTVSNTDGDVTAEVRANQTAGFSIVKWTNNGNNTPSNHRVGHGLGTTPDLVITKRLNDTGDWNVYSGVFSNVVRDELYWNTNAGKHTSSVDLFYRNSSTFGIRANSIGSTGDTHIAYVFKAIDQFSAIGTYIGNGSSNGNFIWTGFRVKFLMRKNLASQNWLIHDRARDPVNSAHEQIYPSANNSEYGFLGNQVDLLSNGFKIRGNNAGSNDTSGSAEYLYIAFAENPFKYARADR